MSFLNDITAPIWFTIGILLVAVFLGLWQWFDRRSREVNLSAADRDFFVRQDRRRYFGVGVMTVLAALLPFIPNTEGSTRPTLFGAISLLVVCGLIIVLLALAFLDGLATRRFARRQLSSLEQERTKLLLGVIVGRTGADSSRRKPDQKSGAPEL
jgi:hypothetical protein